MAYFILLVIWTIVAYPISKQIAKKDVKKAYCWFVFIPATLLMGLRSRYVGGVDTDWYYIPNFQRVCQVSLKDIFSIYGDGDSDLLFYILSKLFSYVSENPYAYIFTIAVFVMGAYCIFVYRYSEQPVLTFLIYYALGYYSAGYQFLRHMIAVSILLFCFPYIRDRKLFRFVILVLLAGMFHSTALVFLIAYPLAHIKIGLKQWGAIMIAVLLCYYYRTKVFQVLSYVFGESARYAKFTTGEYGSQISIVGFLLVMFVYVFSYFFSRREIRQESQIEIYFNLSAISACFMSLIVILGEFLRISMFFGVYNTILLPCVLHNYLLKSKNKEVRVWILLAFYSVFIIYFLCFRVSNDFLMDYRFYWSD